MQFVDCSGREFASVDQVQFARGPAKARKRGRRAKLLALH